VDDIAWEPGGTSYERLRAILADAIGVDEEDITLESSLEELGADSLDLLEFVMNGEDQFSCDVADEKAEKIRTFSDAVRVFAAAAPKLT
jgi:acyl carrier protein